MAFHRAQRQRVYIKIALTGPSGSGKTYSALRLAFGMVQVADGGWGMGNGKSGNGEWRMGDGGKPLYRDATTRVALIDTENGSGSLYAHLGEYDVQEIGAPFTVQKYVEAIA